ncbi:MAG: sugar phosphate isomerase/epimerase [Thaumarchaeota archaeon]|nr:sugar phosphate isomerase/epimerase [Nitrososphaerota archaeon]
MDLALGEGFMFREVPFEKSLKKISKIGFDSVELLWGTRYDAGSTDDQIRELKKAVRKHDLKVSALLGGGALASLDAKIRAQAVGTVRRQIEIAQIFDCRMITAEMSGGTSKERDKCIGSFKESVRELLPALEKADISMSFEPHPGDFIEESNMGADVLRSIKSKRIGYLYCCPHTFVLGEDPEEMIKYVGTLLNFVHVADTHKMERIIVSLAPRGFASLAGVPEFEGLKAHEHLTPGHGEVPFDSVFKGLKSVGFDGIISCVPFSPDDPEGAAKESFKIVRKYIKRKR